MHSFVWKDFWNRTKQTPPHQPDDSYSYDWPAILSIARKSSRATRTRQHMVVDEGQDLPVGFFEYASRHVAQTMTVFADEDQAVGQRHTSLEQIKSAAGLANPVILRTNHRNRPEVARLAEHFHGGRIPAATVRRSNSGELPELLRLSGLEKASERIATWFLNRGGTVGVIVSSNEVGSSLHSKLANKLRGRRVDSYDSNRKNEDSIDILRPGVTVLNKRSVKGQEFDTVFIVELESFLPCANEPGRRAMYMMCSRARDHLFLVCGPDDLPPEAKHDLPGLSVLEGA